MEIAVSANIPRNGAHMPQYFVEGLFTPKKSLKKARKTVEPYARVIWANTPAEAARQASEELAGGQWVEGPTVSDTTEEQRMRQIGAPEFPGFGLESGLGSGLRSGSRKSGAAKKRRK
jgi:hypothetical protein